MKRIVCNQGEAETLLVASKKHLTVKGRLDQNAGSFLSICSIDTQSKVILKEMERGSAGMFRVELL